MTTKTPNLIINVHSAKSGIYASPLIAHSEEYFQTVLVHSPDTSEKAHNHVFVNSLKDLHGLLLSINRTDIGINFIGDILEYNDSDAIDVLTFRALLNQYGALYLTNMVDGKPTTREIMARVKTILVQCNTTFKIPEDILPRFKVINATDRESIVKAIEGNHDYVWDLSSKTEVSVETSGQVLLLDNGKSPSETCWLTKLCSIYRNCKLRMQVYGDTIDFVRFTPEEDTYLRFAKGENLLSGGMLYLANSKLIKEGYVHFDLNIMGEDGKRGGYALTSKGLSYRNSNISRKSISEHLSVDDIIINIIDGSLYQVMEFDILTGKFLLCSEDNKALRIDSTIDNQYFHATQEEKAKYLKAA